MILSPMTRTGTTRFVDWTYTATFADRALVVCPNCRGEAVVTSTGRATIPVECRRARIHCPSCGFSRTERERKWLGPAVVRTADRCPNCGFKWVRTARSVRQLNRHQENTRAGECPACHVKSLFQVRSEHAAFDEKAIDPYYGLPLWLQTRCCGSKLWAFNGRHLQVMKDYAAATIRERGVLRVRTTLTAMPKWFKSAKNRDEVLRCIGRLEKKLLVSR